MKLTSFSVFAIQRTVKMARNSHCEINYEERTTKKQMVLHELRVFFTNYVLAKPFVCFSSQIFN